MTKNEMLECGLYQDKDTGILLDQFGNEYRNEDGECQFLEKNRIQNNYENPQSVKCNWCDWQGNENELIVYKERANSDDGEGNEHCPNCNLNGYIMDIE